MKLILSNVWLGACLCTGVTLSFIALADAAAPSPDGRQARVFWDLDYKPASNKYGVEGAVWAIGDPVHETLTLQGLINAGLVPKGTNLEQTDVQQFVRGVIWNDDPCGYLFLNSRNTKPSLGIAWFTNFVKPDNPTGFACRIEGRSHFGDLQFLHGMANADGVDARDTLELMIGWSKIAYGVAVGTVKPWQDLSALPAPFNSMGKGSFRELFRAPNYPLVPERAIGSLLHMVQDSYAGGHTSREPLADERLGAIMQFHSYTNQDHDKHKADDMWKGGTSDLEKIKAAKGGRDALESTTQLLAFYSSKAPWETVEQYLRGGPWQLTTSTSPSGP